MENKDKLNLFNIPIAPSFDEIPSSYQNFSIINQNKNQDELNQNLVDTELMQDVDLNLIDQNINVDNLQQPQLISELPENQPFLPPPVINDVNSEFTNNNPYEMLNEKSNNLQKMIDFLDTNPVNNIEDESEALDEDNSEEFINSEFYDNQPPLNEFEYIEDIIQKTEINPIKFDYNKDDNNFIKNEFVIEEPESNEEIDEKQEYFKKLEINKLTEKKHSFNHNFKETADENIFVNSNRSNGIYKIDAWENEELRRERIIKELTKSDLNNTKFETLDDIEINGSFYNDQTLYSDVDENINNNYAVSQKIITFDNPISVAKTIIDQNPYPQDIELEKYSILYDGLDVNNFNEELMTIKEYNKEFVFEENKSNEIEMDIIKSSSKKYYKKMNDDKSNSKSYNQQMMEYLIKKSRNN